MSAQQWYMAVGGHQLGPVSEQEVIASIENGTADGNTLVFTAGMTNWTPIAAVPSLAAYLKAGSAPPPPPMPGKTRRAHEIDFRIFGEDMQFVEVELDPGESAVAEAGAMMYMTDGIQMETVFGDGSSPRSGVMGALLGAGKRLITGESLFMTVFTNQGVTTPIRIRSMVGLIPLYATERLEEKWIEPFPVFKENFEWFIKHRQDLVERSVTTVMDEEHGVTHVLSVVDEEQLEYAMPADGADGVGGAFFSEARTVVAGVFDEAGFGQPLEHARDGPRSDPQPLRDRGCAHGCSGFGELIDRLEVVLDRGRRHW